MRKLWLAGLMVAGAATMWAQDDPPSRVARLNFLEGSVSFQAAGHDDWAAATPNYPLTVGDHLWADDRSHAELHIGSTAIRMDSHTAIAFLNLDDRMTQVRLSDGTINISVRYLDDNESYEVDTPNGAVTLLRPGRYRIDADPDRQLTTVTVRGGEAEVTAGDQAFPVHARQSAYVTGVDQPNTEVAAAGPSDDFDHWWERRDDREDRRPPPRYVSREMNGYEDLDDYGTWRDYPGYGPCWVPRVEAGWAPYHNGHWVWVEPWGWTWVDDAPWGFAPFHYGRWAFYGGGWVWLPGAVAVRPVYAPALVAWVGGAHFGVGIGIGGGVGWFPLGPREAYIPSYRVSNTYVTRVNVTNVTNVTNITNVTNVTYVNQRVPGAVTAVSRTDFVSARPVARVAVAVPASAVASAQVSTRQIPVSRQEAVAARPMVNTTAARPPQSVVSARVVTKTAPPPATAALARPTAMPASRPSVYQPAQQNRPGQPEPNRPPAAQSQPTYRPPAAQSEPTYRPPVTQSQPTNRPPATRPEPAYRPQTQAEPANRPARPESTYRPPPPQARTESAQPPQHQHGPDRPPAAERRQPSERPRPEKEKEKSK
jgi:uncharacterized protein DUF6600/FecR-like protein